MGKINGFIMSGPPGCGKTTTGKSLAHTYSFTFISVKAADVKGEYVGHSAPKVKILFKDARISSPSIIFFDEADAILAKRGTADVFNDEIVNQFLPEVEGIDTGKDKILIIIATNRPDRIDEAVKSRLYAIEIPLPDKENRGKMFLDFLGLSLDSSLSSKENEQKPSVSEKILAELVEKSDGLSGRDIRKISNRIKQEIKRGESLEKAIDISFNEIATELINDLKSNHFDVDLYSSEHPYPSFSNIIGESFLSAKQMLEEFLKGFHNNKIIDSYGLRTYKEILLSGPSGNRQGFMAKVLANELKFDLAVVSPPSLFTMRHMGPSPFMDMMNKALKLSCLHRGIVLFFPEISCLLDGSLNLDFIQTMKMIREVKNTVIMGATSKPLDESVIKQFDIHIPISNPSSNDRKIFLERFINEDSRFTTTDLNIDRILQLLEKRCPNPNIQEIEEFCDLAKRKAVLDHCLYDKNGSGPILKEKHFPLV